MRILITNDDGVNAEGLVVLERIARAISDDVWVVAPESDQSGVGHSLSLSDPLRLRQVSEKRFAVRGTPTDCVLMGVRLIMRDRRPDLVLSGVNKGHNVAEDVIYSGTIAAAMEGCMLGIPSIALSQSFPPGQREAAPWDCAAAHGERVIRKVLELGMDADTLVNVNFPPCGAEEVTGVAVTAQGRRDPGLLDILERADGRLIPYYWLTFRPSRATPGNGTDLKALQERRISVTPLRINMTDEPLMTRYARAFS
ncbi:5'/3'-nucleotidase SurE [Camelimonas abortus]|uniref:5'-nucleotidase SurE n=1 Tax=Camelimonas abortus TaxID=1017184 RepID=A0ABV7LI18_9HYPH